MCEDKTEFRHRIEKLGLR